MLRLFLLVLLPSLALAQTPTDRLVVVRASGSVRFSEAEIASASGLVVGSTVSDTQAQQAAERLSSTGMFSELAWTATRTPGRGTTVEFRVSDMREFVPAVFDNFVWLTRDELLKRIVARVPLFRNEIPLAGNMTDLVAEAITAELRTLGVTGSVSYIDQGQPGKDITAVLFTVEGTRIPVRTISFPGTSADLEPLLAEGARALLDESYRTTRTSAFAQGTLVQVFRKRGYLRATFATPVTRLVGTDNGVAVTVPVEQGAQYRLSEIRWRGNTAFGAAELSKALKVTPGQLCDQIQLEQDALSIATAYGVRGHLAAKVVFTPVFDDAARTVVADAAVDEGPQFRMGELRIDGLDAPAAGRLRSDWTLKTGDVFNSLYPTLFVQAPQRAEFQRRYKVDVSRRLDPSTRTVDVTLAFVSR